MQPSLHFKSRQFQQPAEIISYDTTKTLLTVFSLVTAIFAIIELIIS